jgi:penicillin-binding protein 1A
MAIGSEPTSPSRPRWRRRLLLAAAVLAVATLAAVGGTWHYLAADLPKFDRLLDYRPKEATKVFAADGSLVAEFYEERRTVVPPEQIPEVMRKAILAAEDAEFYRHEGLDYTGIARAALKLALSGEARQGGSTITQQVVKTFLLSPEKTFERKLREMILARRLEKNLTKDEILHLYLNQIYFGHRRYGVEEASRFFFGKGVAELSLGEAAVLAGVVQSPARLSPVNHPEAAKHRQLYVLGQMLANGWITRAQHDREVARPITVAARPPPPPGAWYAEEVRRYLVDRYGEERVLTGGLRVTVAMDPRLQDAADRALRDALRDYDRRHGFRGTLGPLSAEARSRAEAAGEGAKGEGTRLAGHDERPALVDVRTGRPRPATPGTRLAGLVEAVTAGEARLWFGGATAILPRAGAEWAGKPLTELLPVGEVVLAEVAEVDGGKVTVRLAQEPEVQGALVAVEPSSGRVRVLAGGYEFGRSSFNRATQARRQPGSAFKPFVYGAALETGKWNAASLVVDAPETFRDAAGREWRPQNYDFSFAGTMPLLRAVALSKNTVAVRMLSELGIDPVLDFARRAGIRSPLPRNLTLALGTGEVTPLELCSAYATLAAGGIAADPVLVEEVRARDGSVLEVAGDTGRPALQPEATFILTHLLEAVIREGTGYRAAELARPVAGKTGTTSDGRDAWFAGYTPDLAAVSWIGFDDQRKLGRGEGGGRTAIPPWLALMREAHSGRPISDFPVPPGVELVAIDLATGLLAPATDPGTVLPFVAGTAPTERAVAPGVTPTAAGDLFLEDDGGWTDEGEEGE